MRLSFRVISFLPVLVLLSTPQAFADAGDQLWQFQGIEDIHSFVTLPDIDGDGVPDVVIETYDAGASGDHLNCIAGADGALIWSCRPESGVSNGGGWGDNCLARADDLSGDGFPDVLVATAWGNCSVHAVNGRTGDLLWTFDTFDEPADGWVYSVAAIADRTGDGHPEVVCAVGSDNDRGYLLDGATGNIIWRFLASTDALMLALPLPDCNDDGVQDILFCGSDYEHRVFCVSGAGSGAASVIWSRDTGDSNHAACLIDDITGDGLEDVVIGNWANNDQVKCLDSATGIVRWTFDNGTYQSVMRLVDITDINGDGIRDVAIGSFERAVRVISGADGQLIWESWAGTINGGDCWAVDRLADVNGDGLDEVIAGSFDKKVYLYNGRDGDLIWEFDTGHRLYTVRGSGDLSGSGCADVLAGTQSLSGVGGKAFAIEGGVLTAIEETCAVEGTAVMWDSAPPRVELSWTCTDDLPFRVYLCPGEKSDVRAARRGDDGQGIMSNREVIARLRSASGGGPLLINETPVAPEGLIGGHWVYGLTHEPATRAEIWGACYRLTVVTPEGNEVTVCELYPSRMEEPPPPPLAASLHPNPFNPRTTVSIELEGAARVSLRVYDSTGRLLDSRNLGRLHRGTTEVNWVAEDERGRSLPAGVYMIALNAVGEWGEHGRILRAVLLK